MTNPKNKKTLQDLINETKHLNIVFISEYVDTDTKIKYICQHGENESRPWQLKKQKFCCRKDYYNSGIMWSSNKKDISYRQQEILSKYECVNVDEISIDSVYVYNIKCTKHNIVYNQRLASIQKGLNGCKQCKKETKILYAKQNLNNNNFGGYVSKAETNWLDKIAPNCKRQYWLNDVKYKVDGFDETTNTVYLYHGRFWHGCPETYDPEMVHPVVKLKMKDLYEKTKYYENKIIKAGYNLIVEWGT
jgi:hypothetical protein